MAEGEDLVNVLMFTAKLISDFSGDKKREFVITFFLSDQTLQVYEMAVPNSGFRPGRFLQRQQTMNAKTKKLFKPSDFYIGARVVISGRTFELIEAAPHTLSIMEAHSNEFPEASVENVANKLRDICTQTNANLRQLFEVRDIDASRIVSKKDAQEVFASFEPKLSKQAAITLLRAFEKDGDKFDYPLFLDYMKL